MQEKSGEDRLREFVEKVNRHKSPQVRAEAARDVEERIKRINRQSEERWHKLEREWEEEEKMEELRFDKRFGLCKHDFSLWEKRFEADTWELKKVVEWISRPEEWGNTCFDKKDIPKDMAAYKTMLCEMLVTAINEKELKCEFDLSIDDYRLFPLQILTFLRLRSIMLPLACRLFLQKADHEALHREVTRSVKSKKIEVACNSGTRKRRSDQLWWDGFAEIVQREVTENPPKTKRELLTRTPVRECLKKRPFRKSRSEAESEKYLLRKISKYLPEALRMPGRRKK